MQTSLGLIGQLADLTLAQYIHASIGGDAGADLSLGHKVVLQSCYCVLRRCDLMNVRHWSRVLFLHRSPAQQRAQQDRQQ